MALSISSFVKQVGQKIEDIEPAAGKALDAVAQVVTSEIKRATASNSTIHQDIVWKRHSTTKGYIHVQTKHVTPHITRTPPKQHQTIRKVQPKNINHKIEVFDSDAVKDSINNIPFHIAREL